MVKCKMENIVKLLITTKEEKSPIYTEVVTNVICVSINSRIVFLHGANLDIIVYMESDEVNIFPFVEKSGSMQIEINTNI